MKHNMINVLIGLALLLLAWNGWMYLQQPAMLFYPQTGLDATPADWGLAYQDVELLTSDAIKLHGWYIPAARHDEQRVLLFMHGNAGNISHRGESVQIFHQLGLNVLIFDYRGYGQSQGRASEAGLYSDATAAWHYLTETRRIAPENIILFGRSLGGVVAAELASRVQPGLLVLESTFSSARDMAKHLFPRLSNLLFLRYRLDTAEYVRHVNSPVLILHSPNDEIAPYALGQKVYAAASEPKQFVPLRGDHNAGFLDSQPAYERALAEFISRHLPRQED